MAKFRLTAEQEAIMSAFTEGKDLRVQAGAGAGKSSTLIEAAAARDDDDGLFLAYNRAIKDDMARRAPINLSVSTSHSLAFGKAFKHRLNNGSRLPVRETARRLGAKAFQIGEHPPLGEFLISRMVNDMVRRFTYSADDRISVEHVEQVKGYGPEEMRELAHNLVPLAWRAWEDLCREDGQLFYTHDHYLKQFCLSRPKLKGDFLMLDESQDSNPALVALIQDQTHMQRISVGDSAQSIYGWRGAKDAYASLPGEELTLTQSFRFGPAIAQEANDWLEAIDAPIRLRGLESIESELLHNPEAGTVLCRSNMGCMAEAMTMMDAGHKVAVVGGVKQLQDLANACIEMMETGRSQHPELLAFEGWDEVREYSEDKEGSDLRPLVQMVDRYTPKYLLARTRELTEKEDHADRIVSTAHKAKGREWDHVRLSDDFHQEPEYDPETGRKQPIEMTRDEAMLCYVTVTRAKLSLDSEALDWFLYEDVVIA